MPMGTDFVPGVMKIARGVGAGDPYTIEELGSPLVQLTGSNEVDLVPHYEGSWEAVTNLCLQLTSAKLCQDIEAGIIVIAEQVPPRRQSAVGL